MTHCPFAGHLDTMYFNVKWTCFLKFQCTPRLWRRREKLTWTKAERNATHGPFVYQLDNIGFNIKTQESRNVILQHSVVLSKLVSVGLEFIYSYGAGILAYSVEFRSKNWHRNLWEGLWVSSWWPHVRRWTILWCLLWLWYSLAYHFAPCWLQCVFRGMVGMFATHLLQRICYIMARLFTTCLIR